MIIREQQNVNSRWETKVRIPLFNMKAVLTGSYKAIVGAIVDSGAESSCKPEREPKQIVSAPQH